MMDYAEAIKCHKHNRPDKAWCPECIAEFVQEQELKEWQGYNTEQKE